MKKIIFTSNLLIEDTYYPQPAYKNIPDWYKKTNSFTNSNKLKIFNNEKNQTIKKCMPVFDSMTAGYIIKTYVDVYVEIDENGLPNYIYPIYDAINVHSIDQALFHPVMNGRPFPKWMSPWSIKTPKGYSCLFLPPMHNPNGIFTIMPGIVDTDSYINPVNFPFTMDYPSFEGIIPAGTPICQVIPFKRDSFKMNIGNDKDIKNINKFLFLFQNKLVNNYKNKFWNRKQYR